VAILGKRTLFGNANEIKRPTRKSHGSAKLRASGATTRHDGHRRIVARTLSEPEAPRHGKFGGA
jgi:hypothetical protein